MCISQTTTLALYQMVRWLEHVQFFSQSLRVHTHAIVERYQVDNASKKSVTEYMDRITVTPP